jgi:Uma2 family endonuclease
METVTTLPRSRPLTRRDLEALPDDGHRYEIVDGALIVTPAPSHRHQRVVTNLIVLFHAACPNDLEVLTAPFDVALDDTTVLQPDLLVARRSDFTERDLPAAPLLAVEVLSPSTRLIDLTLKRSRYESAACSSYWVVDPDEPRLVAWELREGAYAEVARVAGDEVFVATQPFAVGIAPRRLLR